MKKIFVPLVLVLAIFSANVEAASLGKSKIFSPEELSYACEFVNGKIIEWGCTPKKIKYAGDKFNNEENISYLNSLADSRGFEKKFTKCMVLLSDFRSPPAEKNSVTLEPDKIYKKYQWWFGFYEVDGEWKPMTWGY